MFDWSAAAASFLLNRDARRDVLHRAYCYGQPYRATAWLWAYGQQIHQELRFFALRTRVLEVASVRGQPWTALPHRSL